MPELPEVETTVRGLAPGARRRSGSTRVEPRRADLRRPIPGRPAPAADRARPSRGLARRAKYGLIDTDRGDTMIFHLGMSGRWRIDPERDRQARPSGDRDRGGAAARAQRSAPLRLGRSGADRRRSTPGRRSRRSAPSRSGRTSPPRIWTRRSPDGRAPIKLLLLDQRIVAGLGNIYVCEALYRRADRARRRPAGRSARPRLARLVDGDARRCCDAAIEAGGSTLARLCPARRRARLFLQAVRASMAARASRARAAARSSGGSRAGDRPSGARSASASG